VGGSAPRPPWAKACTTNMLQQTPGDTLACGNFNRSKLRNTKDCSKIVCKVYVSVQQVVQAVLLVQSLSRQGQGTHSRPV
jgi:hypothetical protein